MKISDKQFNRRPIIKFNIRHTKRIFITLMIVLTLFGVLLIGIAWGGYLQKAGRGKMLISKLISVLDVNVQVLPNMIKAKRVDIDKFQIDIKFINMQKLKFRRKHLARIRERTLALEEQVPAKISYNNEVYKVDIGLTGSNPDHYGAPDKWSLNVKVKNDKTIMGMRKFNLLIPFTRGYLTDWIATHLSKARGLLGLRHEFVEVTINGTSHGLYLVEQRFDKELVESNNETDGILFRIVNEQITPYQQKRIQNNEKLKARLILLKQLWQGVLNNQIKVGNLFDLKKMASMAVITDLLRTKHGHMYNNQRFYFNPITNLCEPILRENEIFFHSNTIRKLLPIPSEMSMQIEKTNVNSRYSWAIDESSVWKRTNNNIKFKEYYLIEAALYTNKQYLDSVLYSDVQKELLMNKVYIDNPFYIFPEESLNESVEYIKNKLYPKTPSIDVFISSTSVDSISFLFENKIELPIEIMEFLYDNEKIIKLNERLIIDGNHKDDGSLQSFNLNLPSTIDTILYSAESFEVFYSILGLNEMRKVTVYPSVMKQSDFDKLNTTKQSDNVQDFDFLLIKNINKTIEFSQLNCEVSKDLILPAGYKVFAKPGCQIVLSNSARIISYSPLLFYGEKDSLITISSKDSTGQGIVVLNCPQVSELNYVNFNNLSNISSFGWDLTAAITFYKSPVNINNCTFSNNLIGDDYLNIKRTKFTITNTKFENTYADAFDADFCTGSIISATFINIGNDAIDVSGTKLKLETIVIENSGDKGISAGEKSHLICKDIDITGGEIAIASKDNSIIELNNINITSCKLAYVAFQKKSEFGPGKIVVKNAISVDVETEYLVENGSSLSINGNQINKKSKKVKEKLYGKEYGKASK
jgi:hypothetical protein